MTKLHFRTQTLEDGATPPGALPDNRAAQKEPCPETNPEKSAVTSTPRDVQIPVAHTYTYVASVADKAMVGLNADN